MNIRHFLVHRIHFQQFIIPRKGEKSHNLIKITKSLYCFTCSFSFFQNKMDAFFETASAKMGGTPTAEQLKIVASILSSYPCAMLFKLIPNSQVQFKHLFSICITSYIMISVLHYYEGFIHITLSCLFTYAFMKYYKKKNGAWINFYAIMLSMSLW